MALRSFIEIAKGSDFPLENLPFGVFQPKQDKPRAGVAIGDLVVDLSVLEELGHFQSSEFQGRKVFSEDSLNPFLALGRTAWRKTREILQHLLAADTPILRDDPVIRRRVFRAQKDVIMKLPARIGNYTDFYSSYHHAHNVGTMLRGAENALMPNWKWLPVAYHGRASSVVISGTDVRRPSGQTKAADAATPTFGATKSLDYELEMAFLIGPGNSLGEPVPIDRAMDHIFGLVLVNDWSARDIQAWEYQPLGPFLGKSFATTVSPWIVTLDALEPFRVEGPEQNPTPLEYLRIGEPWAYAIRLAVDLQTQGMRERGTPPEAISHTTFRDMYWNVAQQLAHATANGAITRPGDLFASGTISGSEPHTQGSLIELSWNGERPISLQDGETRTFLEDGDEVTLRGWCERPGARRIGFGSARGRIEAAG